MHLDGSTHRSDTSSNDDKDSGTSNDHKNESSTYTTNKNQTNLNGNMNKIFTPELMKAWLPLVTSSLNKDAATVVRKIQSYPLARFIQRYVYMKVEKKRKKAYSSPIDINVNKIEDLDVSDARRDKVDGEGVGSSSIAYSGDSSCSKIDDDDSRIDSRVLIEEGRGRKDEGKVVEIEEGLDRRIVWLKEQFASTLHLFLSSSASIDSPPPPAPASRSLKSTASKVMVRNDVISKAKDLQIKKKANILSSKVVRMSDFYTDSKLFGGADLAEEREREGEAEGGEEEEEVDYLKHSPSKLLRL